jgi:hypothetical protein
MNGTGWIESDREINKLLSAYNKIDLERNESSGMEYDEIMNDFRHADTAVKNVYGKEVVDLVQTMVVPNAKRVMPPARGIRRYITMNPNKGPAKRVHNDYGLEFDEIVDRNPFFDFKDQRKLYEEDGIKEYMLINLWRPIEPMSANKPLRSFPLAFLDSSTVRPEDFVNIDYKSLGVITALKESPSIHKFYYYPDMTTDEVVVFKQFHHIKNEQRTAMPTFHTAFSDPAADDTTEDRVSFEYRVSLFI